MWLQSIQTICHAIRQLSFDKGQQGYVVFAGMQASSAENPLTSQKQSAPASGALSCKPKQDICPSVPAPKASGRRPAQTPAKKRQKASAHSAPIDPSPPGACMDITQADTSTLQEHKDMTFDHHPRRQTRLKTASSRSRTSKPWWIV